MVEDKSVLFVEDQVKPPTYFKGSSYQSMRRERPEVKSSRRSKALFGYAVAATTALIVVLVMGGVYYYRSLDIIQESIKKFHLIDNSNVHTDGIAVSQDVEINTVGRYIVMHLNGATMESGTLVVLDYTNSMIGLYKPESRHCHLIGGINSHMADFNSMTSAYENFNSTEVGKIEKRVFYYVEDDTFPVNGKKILPEPLKNFCTGLPTYWMQPSTADTFHKHRIQKRGLSTTFAMADGSRSCCHCAPEQN